MIPYGKHHIDEEDIAAVVEVLKNQALTQGPTVDAFEKNVADYVGVKYAVAVSSCTAALHMAALAAGVKQGKRLITSPITFVSTSNAAFYAGGKPGFSDIDPKTLNLCPKALEETLAKTPDVAAIAPVHFGGLPCDMEAIKSVADKYGAVIIEDAAHAIGATYPNGKHVGSCENSLMTVFSFHPVKQIAAGEGGMICTNDEQVYRFLLRFRSHGINKLDDSFVLQDMSTTEGEINPWYYEMLELGMHYRITDIQCALGNSQLKKLDTFVKKRRDLAIRYDEALTGFKHIRPAQPMQRNNSGLHLYALRINFEAIGTNRVTFMKKLREKDIGSQVHYIPVPSNPYYRDQGFNPDDYPAAMEYYQQALSIPLFYDLTYDQQDMIIATLAELTSN